MDLRAEPPRIKIWLVPPREWAKTYNHNGEYMCSIDVSSLFINVPLDETIQICLDKLYALANRPKLPPSILKDLLY